MSLTQALPGPRFRSRAGFAPILARLRACLLRGHDARQRRAWLDSVGNHTLADLGLDRQEMLYAPPELIEHLAEWRRGG